MYLITALTTHALSAGALMGACATVLALSGVAILWARAERQMSRRIKRPR
jgi:hypothetical protein